MSAAVAGLPGYVDLVMPTLVAGNDLGEAKRAVRHAFLVLLAVASACVPVGTAANEDAPAGGLEVSLAPSAATKGVPFTATDGWTVTIEEFAIYTQVYAAHTIVDPQGHPQRSVGGGGSDGKFMVPGPTCSMRVTAIAAGAGTASVEIGDQRAIVARDRHATVHRRSRHARALRPSRGQ